MSKLDPKPTAQNPLKGWKDLNSLLQSNFKVADKNNAPKATVDISKYEMSKEEIISVAQSQGYKVTDLGNDYLKFE
ncbi:hypothetical protein BKP56_07230 [Marinilactibacillus sp. 15R]|uniref:hypothetical protein n=1 Tax=Marinilactibacillus sp. 15R TaxID=1911586 RepID=UPI00090AA079|nr:hypothetical protein [Marinilactibacillus sp. 15R]API89058.1 hypothetical protein BKP56_07230 [Marinilactibacillus sp. 15R]